MMEGGLVEWRAKGGRRMPRCCPSPGGTLSVQPSTSAGYPTKNTAQSRRDDGVGAGTSVPAQRTNHDHHRSALKRLRAPASRRDFGEKMPLFPALKCWAVRSMSLRDLNSGRRIDDEDQSEGPRASEILAITMFIKALSSIVPLLLSTACCTALTTRTPITGSEQPAMAMVLPTHSLSWLRVMIFRAIPCPPVTVMMVSFFMRDSRCPQWFPNVLTSQTRQNHSPTTFPFSSPFFSNRSVPVFPFPRFPGAASITFCAVSVFCDDK